MKSERIDLIRLEEKLYHDYCYNNYKLFERGSLETAKKVCQLKNQYDTTPTFDLEPFLYVLYLKSEPVLIV